MLESTNWNLFRPEWMSGYSTSSDAMDVVTRPYSYFNLTCLPRVVCHKQVLHRREY